jgi:hypothetical protein
MGEEGDQQDARCNEQSAMVHNTHRASMKWSNGHQILQAPRRGDA